MEVLSVAALRRLRRISSMPSSAGLLYSLGLGLRALCQFLILTVFARLGSHELAGQFVLATAIITPLQPVTEMALNSVFILQRSEPALAPFLRVRMSAYVLLAAVTVLFLAPVGGIPFWLMALLATSKGLDGVSDIFNGLLQRRGRLTLVAALIMANAAISCAGAVAVMLLGGNPGFALALSASVSGVFVLIVRHHARASLNASQGTAYAKWSTAQVIRSGSTMGLGQSALAVASATPQYVLAATARPADLVGYAFILYVIVGIDLMVRGIVQVAMSNLAKASDRVTVVRASDRRSITWGLIFAPIAALVLVALPLVVELVAHSHLSVSGLRLVFAVGAASLFPSAFMYSVAMLALRMPWSTLLTSLCAGVAICVISVTMIPVYGVTAAVAAIAGGAFTRVVVSRILIGKWRRPETDKTFIKTPIEWRRHEDDHIH